MLAEKRTSLSVMRTGIAVLALPLSVMSILIATSKYYDIFHVLKLLIPLIVLNAILIIIGSFLVVRSFLKIHHHDSLIQKFKKKHSTISEFIV
jgi:Na+-translocating ferredoxin:NAD+ oxidoreductase RnfE subunit